jgi:hypothetical protein
MLDRARDCAETGGRMVIRADVDLGGLYDGIRCREDRLGSRCL